MSRRLSTLLAAGTVLVFVLASVAAASGVATTPVLVVTDGESTELLTTPVEQDTEVALEYMHSVERTPVTDVYVVSDGALVSDRMLFSSFGAGLPSQADVTRQGNRYRYRPPEQQFDPLIVTTGHVADHDLVVDGRRYDLAGIADGGTVRIRIENRLRYIHVI